MPSKQHGLSKRSVVLSTVLFVMVLVTLGALATNVITTMRRSADIRDDERASRAAQSAIRSLKDRVSMTLLDNAGSSDAYQVSQTGEFSRWALEKWRGTSGASSIYDGAVVTTRSGATAMASYKGSAFDPSARFGSALESQTSAALKNEGRPLVEFVKTWDGVDILASTIIHPDGGTAVSIPYAVLSLFRHVRDSDLGLLAEQYQLEGLRLYEEAPRNMLAVALRSTSGMPVAYLGWNRLRPGTRVYQEVRNDVLAAGIILVAFLVLVVIAGGAESRRMARMARVARYEASHDGLSGLLNRSGLLADLDRELVRGGDVTLHLLDLDGFKAVNDTWGHQIGDVLIQRVAEVISGCHPQIVSAARLGGDEFALVQRGQCSSSDFGARVLSLFEKPFEIEGRTVEVGVSIGNASSSDVTEPFELLRRADMALYRAKHEGRGKTVGYEPDLDRDREEMAVLEAALKRAVAEGDITVAYQPLVASGSGKLNGVEALARWQHRTGAVSPEIFIPLAERSGLIDQLGMSILRQSVKAAAEWPELGLSVNVSPVQICNPSFAPRIASLLNEENFEPNRLTLEITEGVLISNPHQAQRAIDVLKKIGVRFALDDFGCGYASIGALRQFGFDSMKIDRSLVWAANDGRGRDVLKATIALATALSIPVTAEGIENEGQADFLRDAGCHQLQGFMMGRPMSAEDLSCFRTNENARGSSSPTAA
ncbi:putative bifunctional diguanylate cyclase/phosphodiesterase [Rhizobium tumorigenes]|uniref:EAL domain-containing protein n=1 Tax=Rhizobium tumorigenes TaxID=2041385 RepID=A0AAF1KU08_9HYPH|nr:EAL domain-containing protein [Rhizobium tumorigenes]WFR97900.1 EAL domain-containing protein [Rhizobium tumorigenes]